MFQITTATDCTSDICYYSLYFRQASGLLLLLSLLLLLLLLLLQLLLILFWQNVLLLPLPPPPLPLPTATTDCVSDKLVAYSVSNGTGQAPTSNVILLNTGNIVLDSDKVIDDNDDAHAIQVDDINNVISVTGRGASGVFLGLQTLLSLLSPNGSVPKVTVYDAPRFRFRGLFLDLSRNFRPREEVERLLGVMAMYKLNKLHLHLTDDEGWRIEIPDLPELTQVGGSVEVKCCAGTYSGVYL